LGNSGLFEGPEALLKTTAELLDKRYVVFGNVLLPRTADMPANAEQAYSHFQAVTLPKLLKGTGVEPDDVCLEPDGRTVGDRRTLALLHRGTAIPVFDGVDGTKRFTFDALSDSYAEWQNNELTRPERERWATYTHGVKAKIGEKAPTVEDYFKDRQKLTAAERARLDKGFSKAAREVQSKHAREAVTLMQGVALQPNGKPQRFVDIDTLSHADQSKRQAEQWRDFADLLSQ
jgi:hypothetical protein